MSLGNNYQSSIKCKYDFVDWQMVRVSSLAIFMGIIIIAITAFQLVILRLFFYRTFTTGDKSHKIYICIYIYIYIFFQKTRIQKTVLIIRTENLYRNFVQKICTEISYRHLVPKTYIYMI